MDYRTLRSLLPVAAAALIYGCASTPEPVETTAPTPEPVVEPSTPAPQVEPEPLVLKPDYPQRYVVTKGDTLWDISERFLRDPWRWPELWYNNAYIQNPHLIYPGDTLTLIYIDGRPTLQVQRVDPGRPTVRLSPRTRIEELERAIPAIPLDAIRPFLQRPRIVGEAELEAAPYIIATADEHLIAATGNRTYVRGIEDGATSDFVVVRKGQVYKNPDDPDEILGYEAIHIADARVLQFGDPATTVLADSRREALNGDRLLPIRDERITTRFNPRAPQSDVQGRIMAVVDGVSQIGQYQVVALNLGQREGMEPGHVLAVYQQGATVRDPYTNDKVTLPDQPAGLVMVFRPFEKMSYGLVMDATRPMHVLDRVTNP